MHYPHGVYQPVIRNCALLFLDHLQLYLMIYHYFMQSSILCILIPFYLVAQTGKHEYSDHKLKQIFRTVIMISWLVHSVINFQPPKVILSSLYDILTVNVLHNEPIMHSVLYSSVTDSMLFSQSYNTE